MPFFPSSSLRNQFEYFFFCFWFLIWRCLICFPSWFLNERLYMVVTTKKEKAEKRIMNPKCKSFKRHFCFFLLYALLIKKERKRKRALYMDRWQSNTVAVEQKKMKNDRNHMVIVDYFKRVGVKHQNNDDN